MCSSDPFVRAGVIVHRPIKDDDTQVTLLCLCRKDAHLAPAVRELQAELSNHARAREARLMTSVCESSPSVSS